MTGTRLYTGYIQTRATDKDSWRFDDASPPVTVVAEGEAQAMALVTAKFKCLKQIAAQTARVGVTVVNIVFPA